MIRGKPFVYPAHLTLAGVGVAGLTTSQMRAYAVTQGEECVSWPIMSLVDRGAGRYDVTLAPLFPAPPAGMVGLLVRPDAGEFDDFFGSTWTRVDALDTSQMRRYASQEVFVVFRAVGGALISGLTPASLTSSSLVVLGQTLPWVIAPGDWREVDQGGSPSGVYAVRVSAEQTEEIGSWMAMLLTASSMAIVAAEVTPGRLFDVWIEVITDDAAEAGIGVRLVSLEDGEVWDEGVTDALGQVRFERPEGEVGVVLFDGDAVFAENLHRLLVRDPNHDVERTPAKLESTQSGPFGLTAGMTFRLEVNGREEVWTIAEEHIPAPYTLASVPTVVLCEAIERQIPGVVCTPFGVARAKLRMETVAKGVDASLQALDASLSSLLGLPNAQAEGDEGSFAKTIHTLKVSGRRIVLATPPPPSDTVSLYARLVSLDGRPLKGVTLQIEPHGSALQSFSSGIAGSFLPFVWRGLTDNDGVAQDVRGLPRLLKGAIVDLVLSTRQGSVRRVGIEVPTSDFTLALAIGQSADGMSLAAYPYPALPSSTI